MVEHKKVNRGASLEDSGRVSAGSAIASVVADDGNEPSPSTPSRKERPILFSGPMVRAILEGRKTQTRRIIKDATGSFWDHRAWKPEVVNGAITHWVSMDTMTDGHMFGAGSPQRVCPYGKPGDRLWVRETHAIEYMPQAPVDKRYLVAYKSTCEPDGGFDFIGDDGTIQRLKVIHWRPSIHMPRWASRITLELVSVRVERLQEISEADAIAEGVEYQPDEKEAFAGWYSADRTVLYPTAKRAYQSLWESINGAGSWDTNPWVWVIEFRRVGEAGTPKNQY